MKVPKTYLNKFKEINTECTAIVQSAVTVTSRFLRDNKYIIPLRVLDVNKEDELLTVLNEVAGDTIDIDLLYPFMLSGILWKDKVLSDMDLPVKGENVIATFTLNDLDELMCSGIITIAKLRPMTFNLTKKQFSNV